MHVDKHVHCARIALGLCRQNMVAAINGVMPSGKTHPIGQSGLYQQLLVNLSQIQTKGTKVKCKDTDS